MTFKSTAQPLCRYCGGPIRKHTTMTMLHIPHKDRTVSLDYTDVDKLPTTKAEAQKHTNGQIMSVRRTLDDKAIDQFSSWDGETYVDEFFCKGEHAKRFAYVMAKADMVTDAYNQARAKQIARESKR